MDSKQDSVVTPLAGAFAEQLSHRYPAPEGVVFIFEEFMVSLKRYPDTKPEFFSTCNARFRRNALSQR
jgi:hypothetical protein